MPKPPGSADLTGLAQTEAQLAQGNQALETQFLQPSLTGVLPAAYEQQVQNATQDATTTIKAKYASLGLSGSTMEAQEIQALNERATALRGTLAQQLAQTGVAIGGQAIQTLGLQGNIYNDLMQATIQQDNALASAIGNFAGQIGRGAAQGQVQKTGQLINVG